MQLVSSFMRSQQNLFGRLVGITIMLAVTGVTYTTPDRIEAEVWTQSQASRELLSEKDRIGVFEKVWKAVNDKYYDPSFNGVDWNAVHERYRPLIGGVKTDTEFYALLNRLLNELHDPHTVFRTPRTIEANKRQQATSTGIILREVEGLPAVFNVEPNSDAARAGVEPGMIVRTIDGQLVAERLALARKEVGASSPERLTLLRVYARLLAGGADTA